MEKIIGGQGTGTRRNKVFFKRCTAGSIHRVDGRAVHIDTSDQELNVIGRETVLVQVVGQDSCCRAHADLFSAADLVEITLNVDDSDQLLGIADTSGNGHADAIRDAVYFLCLFAGDEGAHRGTPFGRKDNTALENNTDSGSSRFNVLIFL